MAMLNLPAARRQHRSPITYAFVLLAFFGAATTLAVVVRDPALSSTTHLPEPVPAPEITVIGEGSSPDPDDGPGWDGTPGVADPLDDGSSTVPGDPNNAADPAGEDPANGSGAGALAGESAPHTGRHSPDDVRRALFWSGVLGLTISLAGLGLVGTRRRMW
ncbi:hypothetical protein D7147_29585 [Micromonospora musae]|uniref:Uncharacterized protein n=1 Tax=Micromonospora musae TaxID=1894970 RepID=A0A3A9YCJ4_9ACTN|nr:hypothetical protein [Micromonospora musae]RKN13997.1 hypothetical protein D7147_29585 [Micromonospora musae]RKN29487.1 hypothetical protein D7044_21780 [Micromonospora musae]